MPLLKQKTYITCPFCSHEFEAEMTQETCKYCSTFMYLDEKGNIKEHEVPEYHDYLFFGALVLSAILSFFIFIEAIVGEDTNEKLIAIVIIWLAGFVGYWWIPISTSLPATRQSTRAFAAIAVAVSLAVVLIMSFGN